MTGLLAFNSSFGSERTGNTGMSLPKNYTRKRSLNAKYDRILGNTHSMRTNRGSTQTLAEVGSQFKVREEEGKEKEKKDNMEIYRKLGIKMPASYSNSRDLNTGGEVMANLERYRLGNIPPPRGKTPPVQLDEKLRNILYPPRPPPTPPAPTPSPIQLLSEQYHPTGAKVGKTTQSSSRTHHPRQATNQHQPAPYPQQQTPLRQIHYPPLPPPPTAIPPPVQGWIFTPQNGWIYIPPPQPYFHQGGYPGIPPPPPFLGQEQGQLFHSAYPSPYSQDEDNASYDQENIPSSHRYTSSPDYDVDQDQEQVRPLPKGILRDASSSEISGHGRSVKFRDTPDYASPELYQREVDEYEYESHGLEPEPDVCSPPRWTLRKTAARAQSSRPAVDEQNPDHRRSDEEDSVRGQENYAHAQRLAYHPEGDVPKTASIPAILATAHQQLLSGHVLTPAQVASGKRSGRDLVRTLENMAEQQYPTGRGGDTAGSTRNGVMETNHDFQLQGDTLAPHQPVTPRRQALENLQSDSRYQNERRQPQDFPRQGNTNEVLFHHSSEYEHDRTAESQTDEPPAQNPFMHRDLQAPGRQFTDSGQEKFSHHAHNGCEEPQIYESARRSPSRHYVPKTSNQHDTTQQHDPYEDEVPLPSEALPQLGSFRHQPKTPNRQTSTINRLPPPSQNWRESQRPQMAFSQTESIGSQVPGSQTSFRAQSQDHPGPNERKRSRLVSEEGQDEDQEEEEIGSQSQDIERYSPDRPFPELSHQSHSQDYKQNSQISDSQSRQESQAERRLRSNPSQRASSSQQQSSPTSKPPRHHQRHRLTDLELPIDIDDPSDTSYQPPNSFSGDQDEDEEYEDEDERESPDLEPEGKRIRLTEGAWMKYDIPPDRLPFIRQPTQPKKKAKAITTRVANPVKNESQSQSQISQIEQPDEDEDTSWLDDDIDESFSLNHSDISGKGNKSGKLSTIAEEEEEEEEGEDGEMEVGPVHGEQKGWVEEGFFGNGGETGFTVWRDQY